MATLQENVKAMMAAGVPEDEIAGYIQTYGGGQKESAPEQPDSRTWGEALYQAVGNTPKSAARFVRDIWNSVTSPIETGKGIVRTGSGYLQKAFPGIMQYDPRDNRAYADAMNKFFKDRYGGVEEVKRAVAEDPVGVLGDLSTVMTGLSGGLRAGAGIAEKAGAAGRVAEAAKTAGTVAAKAGEIADPLAVMGQAAKAASYPVRKAGSVLLDSASGGVPLAEKLYGAAVKPSTTLTPAERQAVIQTGIRERVLPTQAGFDKLRDTKAQIAQDVAGAVADSQQNVDLNRVFQLAREQAGKVHGNTVAPSGAKATIEGVLDDFKNTHMQEPMTTPRAQEVKQATYRALEDAYGDLTGPEKEARKALARGLKEEVAANVPGVTEMNERLGELSELSPVIEKAVGRTQNWNPVGLSQWLGSGAGATIGGGIAGPPGAALGAGVGMATAQALRNPANLARMSFGLDAAGKAKAKIASVLGAVPVTRQEALYPAYLNRMREGE